MDIKAKAEEIITKIKDDPTMLKEFKSEPVKVVEKLCDVKLPEDTMNKLVELVKAKINLDDAGKIVSGLKGLFKK